MARRLAFPGSEIVSHLVAIVAGCSARVFSTLFKKVCNIGSVGTGGLGSGVLSLVLMALLFLLLPRFFVGGFASILGPRGNSV